MPVISKNKKGAFDCKMCNDHKVASFSYIYKTHEILPITKSEELTICEKCAKRESGTKVKDLPFNSY